MSHFYVIDDPDLGMVMHSRPRGRPRSVTKFDCTDEVKNEVSNLRAELGYQKGTKILLLLSLATDEMIRLVTAYPEVFFMDVTANTNRQKRGMFLAVVKDSSGKTFPGSITIVPWGGNTSHDAAMPHRRRPFIAWTT